MRHLPPRKAGRQLGLLVPKKWLKVFIVDRGCIIFPCSAVTCGQVLR